MTRLFKFKKRLIAATVVAGLLLSATAALAWFTDDGTLHICIFEGNFGDVHTIRALLPGEACGGGETAVTLNLQGPPGPQGPTGATGATGATGPNGAIALRAVYRENGIDYAPDNSYKTLATVSLIPPGNYMVWAKANLQESVESGTNLNFDCQLVQSPPGGASGVIDAGEIEQLSDAVINLQRPVVLPVLPNAATYDISLACKSDVAEAGV